MVLRARVSCSYFDVIWLKLVSFFILFWNFSLAVDQTAFQKKLRVALEKHPSYPSVSNWLSYGKSQIENAAQIP